MKYVLELLLASLLLNNVKASSPKCRECNVFATGKDGTLWGWEDDTFCKLSSSCYDNSYKSTTKKRTTTYTTTKKTTIYSSYKKTSTIIKSSTYIAPTSSTYHSHVSSSAVVASAAATTKVSSTSNSTTTSKIASSTSAAASETHKTDAKGNLVCNGCVVTATGGDKSLWGWENEKSCIIDEVACQGKLTEEKKEDTNSAEGQKKDASGRLVCNGCTVTSTGGDGTLWGLENEETCVIDTALCKLSTTEPKTTKQAERGSDGILICSTCEYTRLDDDTTTWNVENGEECRVIGSRCNFNKTPHPWCSGCVVTATGGDGALYGWENNNSCLINEIDCGFIKNPNAKPSSKVEASSATQIYASMYYIIATFVTIFIVRGF